MKKFVLICTFCLAILGGCSRESIKENLDETLVVRYKGADMPVYVHGNIDSKVIVLIVHGGPGGNGPEYRTGPYAEDLETRYAVAYWDQRGQGMSHGKYNSEDLTMELMAEDMRAVVLTLKSKYDDASIFALGHSWGGTVSSKFMISGDNQFLLNGWIEADGAHDIPKLNIDAVKMFQEVGQEQIAMGNNVSNWQDITEWADGIDTLDISKEVGGEINEKGHKVSEWLIEDKVINGSSSGGIESSGLKGHTNPLTSFLSGNYTSNKLVENGIEEVSYTAELNKVAIPSLFLWGRYDFVVPPSLAYDAYNNVSSSFKKIVIFEKSAHSPMDTEWEAFNKEVVDFIESHK
ncbi:MAG: alpha/beta fold hydrolase [Bacteroidia bacterium]